MTESLLIKPSIIIDAVDNASAILVFAHGAGANMHHAFMSNMTSLLNDRNVSVIRFNFPYMDKRAIDGKKYPPNRMPQLADCYRQVLDEIKAKAPIFIAGKSMGGRVAATIAAEGISDVNGVICLGYPFHPAKKPEKLRLEPLQQTKLPLLILQGDRDALGSREEITDYEMSANCNVIYFEDGDHDLKPRVKSGFNHTQHLIRAADEIVKFIHEKV